MPRGTLLRGLLTLVVILSSLLSACENSPSPTPIQATATIAPSPTVSRPTVPADETRTTGSLPAEAPTSAPDQPTATTAATRPTSPPRPTLSPVPARAPNSAEKIAAAEAAGTLDHDTALLYRLYAIYDGPRLPEEYQGDDTSMVGEGSDVLAELSGRLDQLAPAVRAAVAPFFLRPDDPASFWGQRLALTPVAGGGGPGLALVARAATPATTPAAMGHVDAQQTFVRVWYSNAPGKQAVAADLAAEIDRSGMWTKEQAAMLNRQPCSDANLPQNGKAGRTDPGAGRLDIYLVSPGVVLRRTAGGQPATLPQDPTGKVFGGVTLMPSQQPTEECALATFILVNETLEQKRLYSNTAHELFHAFQSAVTAAGNGPACAWRQEAAATLPV